jgi:hypothetical protein
MHLCCGAIDVLRDRKEWLQRLRITARGAPSNRRVVVTTGARELFDLGCAGGIPFISWQILLGEMEADALQCIQPDLVVASVTLHQSAPSSRSKMKGSPVFTVVITVASSLMSSRRFT